jgi:hypothetical protein
MVDRSAATMAQRLRALSEEEYYWRRIGGVFEVDEHWETGSKFAAERARGKVRDAIGAAVEFIRSTHEKALSEREKVAKERQELESRLLYRALKVRKGDTIDLKESVNPENARIKIETISVSEPNEEGFWGIWVRGQKIKKDGKPGKTTAYGLFDVSNL